MMDKKLYLEMIGLKFAYLIINLEILSGIKVFQLRKIKEQIKVGLNKSNFLLIINLQYMDLMVNHYMHNFWKLEIVVSN